ncbi:hypothetical protein DL89DRAFT_269720 [Linderina pennispora]|uniref:F-box domain-containing protein n=1 Tax=Linderina pennispora TaxID=61395 RepID=A0A1Y1W1E2_9FUNG|nr:uncharacterized protein DL89DRAFT_269720 [Linderina pennispora]ORX67302.1 hypothetical protein DL89DRAFT_269720 [Linderina pennispora]
MSSLAQAIPIHILEQIIAYVSGVVRVTSHRLGNHTWSLNKSFIPFIGVCRDWRSVSMMMMYQEVVVVADSECSAEALVKAVHSADSFLRSSLLAKPHHCYPSGPLKDCRFGNTSELILTLDSRSTTSSNLVVAEMEANIKEFAATITRYVSYIDLVAAGRLGLSIEDRAKGYHSLDLPNIARLEHIMLDCDTFGDTHIELVRKSSPISDMTSMISSVDSEGNIVEYPCVWKFDIAMKEAGNPFPRITHLLCENSYPFTNLNFLESCVLLESLYMHKMFKESGWLGKDHFPQLRYVELMPDTTYTDGEESSTPNMLTLSQIALGLSSKVETVKVDSQWISEESDTMHTLQVYAYLSSIRILDIVCMPFTYEQRCSLQLTHEAPGSRQQLSASTVNRLQNLDDKRVGESRLLLLRICRVEQMTMLQMIERVLLFGVLAPSLRRVQVSRFHSSPRFEQSVVKVMKRKVFGAHADRLSKLLINTTY